MFRNVKRVVTQLAISAFVVSSAGMVNATPTGPVYPAPGGNAFSFGPGTSAGDPGGIDFNYSSFVGSSFSNLYWGVDSSALPAAGLDGTYNPMAFSGDSGTTATWDVTSVYTNPMTLVTSTDTIQLAIDVTGLGTTPWIMATSVGLPGTIGAVVDDSAGSNFTANIAFTDVSQGGIAINQLLQPTSSDLTVSSFNGAFYYNPPVVSSTPEPGTLVLMGASLIGFAVLRRRVSGKADLATSPMFSDGVMHSAHA